jgi:hypothetical protein
MISVDLYARRPRTSESPQPTAAPFIAWPLVVAMLIGGLPMMTGMVVVSDSKPAFALDVCQPIGGATSRVSQSEAPLIPTHTAAQLLRESGAAPEPNAAFSPLAATAPDPPPPKIDT